MFCFRTLTSVIIGKKEGKGIMIYNNGDRYEGEWKAGRRHGEGKETWINGVVYEGQWKDGKRQVRSLSA